MAHLFLTYCPLLLANVRRCTIDCPRGRCSLAARSSSAPSPLADSTTPSGAYIAPLERVHRLGVASEIIATEEHLASSRGPFECLNTVARLETVGLVRVKRAYDRDEKRCASFSNERRPSEALAEARSRQLRRSLHYGGGSCMKGFGPSSGSGRPCVRAHWHQRSAFLPGRLGLAYPRASAGSEVDDAYPLTSSSSSSPSASRICLPPYRPRSTFAQLRRLSTIELHSRPSLSPACRQRAWP